MNTVLNNIPTLGVFNVATKSQTILWPLVTFITLLFSLECNVESGVSIIENVSMSMCHSLLLRYKLLMEINGGHLTVSQKYHWTSQSSIVRSQSLPTAWHVNADWWLAIVFLLGLCPASVNETATYGNRKVSRLPHTRYNEVSHSCYCDTGLISTVYSQWLRALYLWS